MNDDVVNNIATTVNSVLAVESQNSALLQQNLAADKANAATTKNLLEAANAKLLKLQAINNQSAAIMSANNAKADENSTTLKTIATEAKANASVDKSNNKAINNLLSSSNALQDSVRTNVAYPLNAMSNSLHGIRKQIITAAVSVVKGVGSSLATLSSSMFGAFRSFGGDLRGIAFSMDNGFVKLGKTVLATVKLGVNLLMAPVKALFAGFQSLIKNSLIGKLAFAGLAIYGMYKFFTGTGLGKTIAGAVGTLWDKFKQTEVYQELSGYVRTGAEAIAKVVAGMAIAKGLTALYRANVIRLLSTIAAEGAMGGGMGMGGGGGKGGKPGGMGKPGGIGKMGRFGKIANFAKGAGGKLLGGLGTGLLVDQALEGAMGLAGADENTTSLVSDTAGLAAAGGQMGGPLGALIGAAIGSWKTAFTEKGGILDMADEMSKNGIGETLGHIWNGLKITFGGEPDYMEMTKNQKPAKKVTSEATDKLDKLTAAAEKTAKASIDMQKNASVSNAANAATSAATAKPNDGVNTGIQTSLKTAESQRRKDAKSQLDRMDETNKINKEIKKSIDELTNVMVIQQRQMQHGGQQTMPTR